MIGRMSWSWNIDILKEPPGQEHRWRQCAFWTEKNTSCRRRATCSSCPVSKWSKSFLPGICDWLSDSCIAKLECPKHSNPSARQVFKSIEKNATVHSGVPGASTTLTSPGWETSWTCAAANLKPPRTSRKNQMNHGLHGRRALSGFCRATSSFQRGVLARSVPQHSWELNHWITPYQWYVCRPLHWLCALN